MAVDEIKKFYLYKITNKVNGKMYIGQTTRTNPRTRWIGHLSKFRSGKNNQPRLFSAFKKYGVENFSFEVINDTCASVDELNRLEQVMIATLRTQKFGYNIDGGGRNRLVSDETRERLSIAHKGKPGHPVSEETRLKIAASHRGVKLSPEHCRRLSESRKGKPRGPQSEEHRRKISEANKGKKYSEAFCKAQSERMKGKKLRLGCKLSEESKERMKITHKLPWTDEKRKRQSEITKNYHMRRKQQEVLNG